MGIIEDAVAAIETWFKGILAGGIEGSLKTTNDMLSNSLNGSDGSGMNPLFGQFLESPEKFTGSANGSGTPVWSIIHTLSDNVIVPIAGFVLCVVVLYELIQMVVSGNNFRDFDTSIFFRWTIKTFCGILLISNVFDITTAIFSFGTSAVTSGLNSLFPSGSKFIDENLLNSSSFHNVLMQQDIGTLIVTLIISFVIIIVTFILLGAIIVVLASRIIEVFMYLSVAPLPFATLMNNDIGQIGKNWLRNVLALAFQGFFIVVALAIFKSLFANALATMMSGNGGDVILTMAILLGFIVAFIFTMFRTSAISKSVFSAH
ncbi:MAG: VirB6/TrbL-like conjugal transfer protein, CD1112 family [Acutalibacteraceae bacterium]